MATKTERSRYIYTVISYTKGKEQKPNQWPERICTWLELNRHTPLVREYYKRIHEKIKTEKFPQWKSRVCTDKTSKNVCSFVVPLPTLYLKLSEVSKNGKIFYNKNTCTRTTEIYNIILPVAFICIPNKTKNVCFTDVLSCFLYYSLIYYFCKVDISLKKLIKIEPNHNAALDTTYKQFK